MLVENTIYCKNCHHAITSRNEHEVNTCSCGTTIVGGGITKPKESGDYMDMKWYLDDKIVQSCLQEIGGATQKEEVLVRVLSALRREGRLIADGELKVIASQNDEIIVEDEGNYEVYRKVKREYTT